ncbi:UDP-glucose 4-epimerase GalE [Fusibacter ferrireducens]|uniref:UDP-glucose 4-epimerase n=1 Tax=Fusibacter ferrireducens TaxID=2785058 RepID=A0ABR9ZUT7_9FIRM|nr:UDP-glucose 4-epimerase GalE [Fusibacter ferrireducens]MBF4694205.1 UDP-glucose 4-epimerase GalE [Fusibacter ferrireducens]
MTILVTGGLGFIGSHTVVELIKARHTVIIVDNLINSKRNVLDKIGMITGITPIFYPIDVTQETQLEMVFSAHQLDGVIHFAGLKAVGESVSKPLDYYFNNIVSTLSLCRLCEKYGVFNIIFSSSATVYGNQQSPLKEDMLLKRTTNPYGETKAMNERILVDLAKADKRFSIILLRYFNPVGAHESGLIGESPNGMPNNLMPYIIKVAKGQLPVLNIYGNDYDTVDGTGVRDYIHVVDLAKGHVQAMVQFNTGVHIYNLGTGQGTSVLELVKTFIEVNKVDVPYEFVGRRQGDIGTCYADPTKAESELGWKAELGIKEMVKDAWRFGML